MTAARQSVYLFVGHNLGRIEGRLRFAQVSEELMARGFKTIYLCPSKTDDTLRGAILPDLSEFDGCESQELVCATTFISSKHWLYIHNPLLIMRLFLRYNIELVFFDNEPHSFIVVQVWTCAKVSAFLSRRRAPRLYLFSWDNLNRQKNLLISIYKKTISRVVTSSLDGVLCGNEKAAYFMASRAGKHTRILRGPQVHIEYERISMARERLRTGCTRIVYMGRIVPEKGIVYLADAARLLQARGYEIELDIYGFPQTGSYIDLLRESLPDGSRLSNTLSKEEMYSVMADSDIFVLPSITTDYWAEQLGLTLVEAMASNCLAIGSDSGAIPEVLRDPKLIFKERDPVSIADLVENIIDNPDGFLNNKVMQRRFSKEYSLESVQHNYMNMFGFT